MATTQKRGTGPTSEQRVAAILASHEAQMASIRRRLRDNDEAEARLEAEYAAADVLRRRLSDERDRVVQQEKDAAILRSRRAWREIRRRSGMDLDLEQRAEQIQELLEDHRLQADDPRVVAYRDWLDGICRDEGITVHDYLDPRITQGRAHRERRQVWCAPVQSIKTALTKAHETAHILCDVDPAANRVTKEDGKTVCVANELAAWRWVIAHGPTWGEEEHRFMAESLRTYRPFATEQEGREIDFLTGESGKREVRMLRAYADIDRHTKEFSKGATRGTTTNRAL
jgi:hypothetical protein